MARVRTIFPRLLPSLTSSGVHKLISDLVVAVLTISLTADALRHTSLPYIHLGLKDMDSPYHILPAYGTFAHPLPTLGASHHVATF